MKVRALQMSDLLKECDDIYTTAMVIAQRSKQIIDERVVPIEDVEDIEDSIQFSDPEPTIEFNDKPMVQALEEYLDGELEWRAKDESGDSSDN